MGAGIIGIELFACARFGPVYPSRPAPSAAAPFADPEAARLVTHVTVTAPALANALGSAAPASGEGTFPLLGAERSYRWERGPFAVSFALGRVVVDAAVFAYVAAPLRSVTTALNVRIEAEPVVNADYVVRLQSVDVHVTSPDARLAVLDRLAGVYDKISTGVAAGLNSFAYDLRPLLGEASLRVQKPIEFALGDASGCARLRLLEVEAGPTVLADGIEKDIALVVAPSVTLPCAADGKATRITLGGDAGSTNVQLGNDAGAGLVALDALPPLANVASLSPGPFTVTIPITAGYPELTRAMAMAFTEGKISFSTEYPGIYLSYPEIYESNDQLVVKVHIGGPVKKLGIESDLDGDIYLVGHPAVVDNELRIPDLEPTIETRSFLLSLKALTDGDRIRDEARASLRLDLGPRIDSAREKLGSGLTFQTGGGCFYGDVDRVEVTGVHPHPAYLRVYVAVTARSRLRVPCAAVGPSADGLLRP